MIATSADQRSSRQPFGNRGAADVAITLPQVRGRHDLDQSVLGAGPKIATFAGWWLFAQP